MKRFTIPMPWVAGVAALLCLVLLPMWVIFVGQRIAYAFPIDYGEGPLLRQLEFLQASGSLAALYGDPGADPYLIVNYPPVYLVASQLVGEILPALMAGRVVSALAGVIVALSIWTLVMPEQPAPYGRLFAVLTTITWFALPIVREWSGVMRVDMLGVALGLAGLVQVRRNHPLTGTALITLALLTKPSLIAAPLALAVWVLTQPWRQWVRVAAVVLAIGGMVVGGITLAGGNIWLHVIQANVNLWDEALARGFWREAWQMHWPLMIGALLVAGHFGLRSWRHPIQADALWTSMAITYTVGGIIVGLGIGKVGAYANYFLEWYAGMVWLLGIGAQRALTHTTWQRWLAVGCVLAGSLAVARYIPLWSETYPKPYGMIEGQRPPRLIVGGYGVWQDLQRERQILDANAVTATALNALIAENGGPIFTDVPGVAAQAGVVAPMQVFEHRQLLDVGLWDQRPMLRMLANGEIPTVVLDYLGNWMTPESIALITTRYAQSGSRGSYDIYQPIAVGAPQPLQLSWGALTLFQVALPPPLLRNAYEPGTILPVQLTFIGDDTGKQHSVMLALYNEDGMVVARSVQPLFAGALQTSDLAAGPLQHLQALPISARTTDGTYRLDIQIDDTPPQTLTTIVVYREGGVMGGESGYLVPGAINDYIEQNGGNEAWGDPLMPAMPFDGMTLQCFSKRCATVNTNGAISTAPLGVWLQGALAVWPQADRMDTYDFTRQSAQQEMFEGVALESVDQPRKVGELLVWLRRDVELWYMNDQVVVGNGGVRYLRLPGIAYRWPATTP